MVKAQRKFSDKEVLKIRNMRKDTPILMIAIAFGASPSTIHAIVSGKYYREAGGPVCARRYGKRISWAQPRARKTYDYR